MIYLAVLHFRRREINVLEVSIWVFVWSFAILAVLFPDVIQGFARQFLFARLFDMLVVGAFTIIFVMTVRSYLSNKKIEKMLEEAIRNKAIEDFEKGKRNAKGS